MSKVQRPREKVAGTFCAKHPEGREKVAGTFCAKHPEGLPAKGACHLFQAFFTGA